MIRAWLLRGEYHRAVELLEALQATTQQNGRTSRLIEVFILHASAEAMQKHSQTALQYLSQAISLAEPEGFIRIFVEEGPVICNLLKDMVATGQGSPYIRQLIEAFGSTPEPRRNKWTQIGAIEPFSEREQQVLRLLVTHLSQREMADELCISVNTVRFHTKNIYSKLCVHGRSEAVQKAKEAGLL
jgi:LuxR family maltose regulon positive regulatory protein